MHLTAFTMSSESVMMRVLEQMLFIIRNGCLSAMGAIGNAAMFVDGYVENERLRPIMDGAIAMTNRLMDKVSVVVGTFSFYDSACVIMLDGVPTAKYYMEMAMVKARTSSFYDLVFYVVCCNVVVALFTCVLKNKGPMLVVLVTTAFPVFCSVTSLSFYERMFYYVCFIVVIDILEKVSRKFSMRSFLCGVYYMPIKMLCFFAVAAFSAACTAMTRVVSDKENTNVVFNWVSTKAYELGALMVSPYVFMYKFYLFFIVGLKMLVEFLFDGVVSVCRAFGRLTFWLLATMPMEISPFVTSVLLSVYRGCGKMCMAEKMSALFWQLPFLLRACFHVTHAIFTVAVYTWTLCTLQACWTQMASLVPLFSSVGA